MLGAVDLGLAMLLSLVAGLAAGVGALPVLFLSRLSARAGAFCLGLGAGVMIGAAAFSLAAPAVALASAQYGRGAGAGLVAGGTFFGAGVFALLNRVVPHEHFQKGREGGRSALGRASLFVAAIAIHNLPEGVAMGVGLAGGELRVGLPLTIGIAVHNMPEGLVVAMSLLAAGWSRRRAVGVALVTGLVEPLGAALGFVAVSAGRSALPVGLAFAAGTMLYVVSDEIIPESHRDRATSPPATWGTVVGFAAMVALIQLFE